MFKIAKNHVAAMLLTSGLLGLTCFPGSAAVSIDGQVQAGGGPVAGSTVTLCQLGRANPDN